MLSTAVSACGSSFVLNNSCAAPAIYLTTLTFFSSPDVGRDFLYLFVEPCFFFFREGSSNIFQLLCCEDMLNQRLPVPCLQRAWALSRVVTVQASFKAAVQAAARSRFPCRQSHPGEWRHQLLEETANLQE